MVKKDIVLNGLRDVVSSVILNTFQRQQFITVGDLARDQEENPGKKYYRIGEARKKEIAPILRRYYEMNNLPVPEYVKKWEKGAGLGILVPLSKLERAIKNSIIEVKEINLDEANTFVEKYKQEEQQPKRKNIELKLFRYKNLVYGKILYLDERLEKVGTLIERRIFGSLYTIQSVGYIGLYERTLSLGYNREFDIPLTFSATYPSVEEAKKAYIAFKTLIEDLNERDLDFYEYLLEEEQDAHVSIRVI